MRLTDMQQNIIDSGIWGGLLLPFFMSIDWGWTFSAALALWAGIMRYKEWKEVKRANDLKERGL